MDSCATPGKVYFIGAGPGAPDLITVRGQTFIAEADLVLYADSLVQASIAALACKPTARIVGSSDLNLAQIVDLMAETARAGGVVARVHTGDPTVFGATYEQMRLLDQLGIPYEVVPGITAAFAAAARLGVELTVPEVTQTVILSRVAGRTPVPAREALPALAAHGSSLALYLSVDQIERVVTELLAGGAYTPETPVAVVYRATWPDEQIVRGTLADIAATVRTAGLTRHALILVGAALRPDARAAPSRLYNPGFAHGRRDAVLPQQPLPAADPAPGGEGIGIPGDDRRFIAVTRAGADLAARLARELGGVALLPARFVAETGGALLYQGPVAEAIQQQWATGRQLVLIMAVGVAVRAIAQLLSHKASDPAVVCLDEAGRSIIPLLGGHRAGANELARRIAAHTGGYAAVTTASDTQGLPALDMLGREMGWQIDPDSALTHAMSCLVNGDPIGCYVDPALPVQRRQLEQWLTACPDLTFVEQPDELLAERYCAVLLVTHRALTELWHGLRAKTVRYLPPLLVVGLGCRRGVPAEELDSAISETLDAAGLDRRCVAALATVDLKAAEPGIENLARMRGLPLEIVPAAELSTLDPADFSPSAARTHFDLPGVAEPCAIHVAGGPLLAPKHTVGRCTVAVALRAAATAQDPAEATASGGTSTPPGQLTLVSLGPGDPRQLTFAARAALSAAEVVVGYQGYIDAIRDQLAPNQQVIASGMQTELERARQALEQAAAGRRVVLVSSGDIGVYAMAGPVFELLAAHSRVGALPEVTVLPGISALQALAARLGAAISHDFCVISLSDLLTPWELIEQRLTAAAAGDFVVALYNPRSHDRHWQLGAALDILRARRPPATPLAFGRNVMRPDERIILTTLAEADPTHADMFTVVLVGNSRSYRFGEWLVTPRGYMETETRVPEELRTRDRADGAAETKGLSSVRSLAAPSADYPIVLTGLAGTLAVVVGGGAVGERKIRGLLAAGVEVRLVSPTATPQLQTWAHEQHISWMQRDYVTGDLAGARLVFAATNQRAVNARVAREAAARGLLCNVADAPDEGNFHLPALHRDRGMTIAVSSGGAAPARAATLRDMIARWLQTGATEEHNER